MKRKNEWKIYKRHVSSHNKNNIFIYQFRIEIDRIGGIMVIVFPSGIVDRGFETPVCQTSVV
jgi:hypothetical protein